MTKKFKYLNEALTFKNKCKRQGLNVIMQMYSNNFVVKEIQQSKSN